MSAWSHLLRRISAAETPAEAGAWSAVLAGRLEARQAFSSPQSRSFPRKSKPKPFRMTAAARTISDDDVARLSDEEAHELFCRLRWPDTDGKPVCPRCGESRCYVIATRSLFKCGACRHQFSVTSGTIWHSRKLPLRRILKMLFELTTAPKGFAAANLSHKMKLDLKTSHVLTGKVREAIARFQTHIKLEGIVEIDGVYFGGKRRRPNTGRGAPPLLGTVTRKRCVLTLAQRGGPVIGIIVEGETKTAILAAVRRYVKEGSIIVTDELTSYDFLRAYFELRQVDHGRCFVDGTTSTNNAESFHSRLRRAQSGVYHRCATGDDFDLYVAEMAYQHSCRAVDTRTQWEEMIGMTIRQPVSGRFKGYWQRRKPKGLPKPP